MTYHSPDGYLTLDDGGAVPCFIHSIAGATYVWVLWGEDWGRDLVPLESVELTAKGRKALRLMRNKA